MRRTTFIVVLFLWGCATKSPYELPEAYLFVDGKKYEMRPYTSCWDYEEIKLCGDAPPITKKKPIIVSQNSKLKLKLDSGSVLSNGYYVPLDIKFYIKAIEKDFPKLVLWENNDEYREEYFVYKKKHRQELEVNYVSSSNMDEAIFIYRN